MFLFDNKIKKKKGLKDTDLQGRRRSQAELRRRRMVTSFSALDISILLPPRR